MKIARIALYALLLGLVGCSGAPETAQAPQEQPSDQAASPEATSSDPAAAPADAAPVAATAEQPAGATGSPASTAPKPAASVRRETPAAQPAPPATQPASGGSTPLEPPAPAAQSSQALPPARPAAPPPPPKPVTAVLQSGASIDVQLNRALSSATAQSGETFAMSLLRDLVADGSIVAARGSSVVGRITEVQGSGRVKGRAKMAISLVEIKVGGDTYPIRTNTISFEAGGTVGRDTKVVGGTAGLGAIIGAIAGGGKGAAIGAAIGGATGAAGVILTKGKEVELPQEQKFTFRLADSVEMKIRGAASGGSGVRESKQTDPSDIQVRIESKLNRFQSGVDDWVNRGGDAAKAQAIMKEVQRLVDEGRPEEAEAKLDEALALIGKA